MIAEQPLALKEVQLRLGVPQHVLIHLCEKGVIEPDFADTSGRGKRRGFSRRNVFEFALALALRRFELPVAMTGLVVRVMRSFARAVAKLVPGLGLPDALVQGQLEVDLQLYDGDLLVLLAEGAGFKRPLLLGARIGAALRGADAAPRVTRLDELPERFEARLQIDLCEIARKVVR
jgi:hypothetical protein